MVTSVVQGFEDIPVNVLTPSETGPQVLSRNILTPTSGKGISDQEYSNERRTIHSPGGAMLLTHEV
jgi:hypothetical protein